MEEVRKDISVASPQENPTRTEPVSFTLQDFFSPQQQPPANRRSPSLSPANVLQLNSGYEHDHFGVYGSNPMVTSRALRPEPVRYVPSMKVVGFDAFNTSSSLPDQGNKRLPEPENSAGERRHERMIKNRASAFRSRARKKVYTRALELEVAHLLKENARLRKQRAELCLPTDAEAPKKKSFHRASTAPL